MNAPDRGHRVSLRRPRARAAATFFSVAALMQACGCAAWEKATREWTTTKEERGAHWKQVRCDVKRKLAESQLEARHLDEALREIEAALVLNPKDAACHVLLARIRLEQGQLAAARAAVDEALKIDPDRAETLFTGGLVAERNENWEEAITFYAKAAAAAPNEADYLAAQAETLVAMGRSADALDLVESRRGDFESNARLHYLAAELYQTLGMKEKSIDCLKKATRAAGDDDALAGQLGVALSQAGRDVEAVGLLEPLVRKAWDARRGRNPRDDRKDDRRGESDASVMRLALASSLQRLGRIDAARGVLDQQLRGNPDDAQAWLLLARLEIDASSWGEAEDAAAHAVRLSGDQPEAHLVAAYIALKRGDYRTAMTSARLASERDTTDTTGLCLLGQSYEARGEYEEARDAYERALQRDPTCQTARRLLQKCDAVKTRHAAPDRGNELRTAEATIGEPSAAPGGLTP